MANKQGGGGKLERSEIITVRLDPKLRYAAELAGRRQRRTLSSLIEYALMQYLESLPAGADLWDPREPDRFLNLALGAPDLLTFSEDTLWQKLKDTPDLWENGCPKRDVIRKRWDDLRE